MSEEECWEVNNDTGRVKLNDWKPLGDTMVSGYDRDAALRKISLPSTITTAGMHEGTEISIAGMIYELGRKCVPPVNEEHIRAVITVQAFVRMRLATRRLADLLTYKHKLDKAESHIIHLHPKVEKLEGYVHQTGQHTGSKGRQSHFYL